MKKMNAGEKKLMFPIAGVLFTILAAWYIVVPDLLVFLFGDGEFIKIPTIITFLSFVLAAVLLFKKRSDSLLAFPFVLLAIVALSNILRIVNYWGCDITFGLSLHVALFFVYTTLALIIFTESVPALKRFQEYLAYAKILLVVSEIIIVISVIAGLITHVGFIIETPKPTIFLELCAIFYIGQLLLGPFALPKKKSNDTLPKKKSNDTLPKKALIEVKEYRMRCNVCGKIFCYSNADLEKNNANKKQAMLSSIGSIAGALGGGMYHSYEQGKVADKALDKIVDYSKCPACHSSDIAELTDEEWKKQKKQESSAHSTPVSPADELKKFKELLDSDVISQKEFDAKKKQLLGL